MIMTLHGLSTMHCNVKTEIRMARESGFGGVEIVESKLLRYLSAGQSLLDLKKLLEDTGIIPVCINALKGIEAQDSTHRQSMLEQCRMLCSAAREILCPTVQVNLLCSLEDRTIEQVLNLISMNLREVAKIGYEYGVRFQVEPMAFSSLNSLKLSLRLIEMCEMQNIGMVIDFWHLWAGGDTACQEVAALEPDRIYGVHFCDGKAKPQGAKWDEAALRSYLPGEGDIDVAEWVKAIKSTGYDGSWSSELYSPKHWEWDLADIAKETKAIMERYILS